MRSQIVDALKPKDAYIVCHLLHAGNSLAATSLVDTARLLLISVFTVRIRSSDAWSLAAHYRPVSIDSA